MSDVINITMGKTCLGRLLSTMMFWVMLLDSYPYRLINNL